MEDSIIEVLNYVALNYPIAGTIFMIVGVLFFIVDLVVSVTPTKKDDAFWVRANDGYFGVLIKSFIRFIPLKNKGKK